MNRQKRLFSNCTVVAVLVTSLLIPSAATEGISQTIIDVPLGPQQSPVVMTLAPRPAKANLIEYQKLAERLKLKESDEMITIMGLSMKNTLTISVVIKLKCIVPMTGAKRHLFATYLVEGPQTGRPTYLLPDWETEIQISPGQNITLRLAFILKKGKHASFEKTLKVYGCFKHSVNKGVNHSVAISRRVGPAKERVAEERVAEETQLVKNDYIDVVPTEPSVKFQLSNQLNKVSVRELPPPTTAMSSGGPSVFLDVLLGEVGTDSRLPFWMGVALAIEESKFDYATAMKFLDTIADYLSRFPDKLARTTIWLSLQGLLLVPTEHRVYIATSVWGIGALPHDAAEVLLFVASEALGLGLQAADVTPMPKGYIPDISPNPGEVVGFDLKCTSGVHIRADRVGNSYKVQVKDAEGKPLTPLIYHRQ